MTNNVRMPDISVNFTIKDIHKIREYNYERQKNMTDEEKIKDTHISAQEFLNYMAERKNKK